MLLVTIPITILSLVFSFVAPRNIYVGNINSNKTELHDICLIVHAEVEEHGFSYALRNDIVKFNSMTDIEFTIFEGNERYITTTTWVNASTTNFIADPLVVEKVLETKESVFIANILFEEHSFCSYYMPIMQGSDAIGVVFAAKNVDAVNGDMRKAIATILIGSWSTFALAGAIALVTFVKMSKDLKSTVSYLTDISEGKLDTDIDDRLLSRNDELGDVGKSAKTMRDSIKNLINYDSLTGLVNRRACHEFLRKAKNTDPSNLYIGLGDLDKFKAINDTYGHAAGDKLLKEASKVFAELMNGKGIASRWGGEEFLFVFQDLKEQEIVDTLNEIISRVRTIELEHEGQTFKTAISIGLGKFESSLDKLIGKADKNMYKAKELGGNRLVK